MTTGSSPEQQSLPTRDVSTEKSDDAEKEEEKNQGRFYCALHEKPARVFAPGVTREREQLINRLGKKWLNGTVLRYYFFDRQTDGQTVMFADGRTGWQTWIGADAQKDVVRRGFDMWKEVGVGIDFKEVPDREEAEIRIGFMRGDGAWSGLGTEILEYGPNERTINFAWDLTRPGEVDTVIHEIGHTLGFPHEHQNPKAGIEWDEEAVYATLAKPPNEWDRQKTYWNILRKLPVSEVEGTVWDPDSIMHYPFEKGLIRKPEPYYEAGLQPAGGISPRDKSWVKALYPPLAGEQEPELKPSQSVLLNIMAGEQCNFTVLPKETRYYEFQTFGASDLVMVLFENDNGELRYRTGDDDSGEEINAHFRIKLIKGRKYVLRVRMYYSERPRETSVMMW